MTDDTKRLYLDHERIQAILDTWDTDARTAMLAGLVIENCDREKFERTVLGVIEVAKRNRDH